MSERPKLAIDKLADTVVAEIEAAKARLGKRKMLYARPMIGTGLTAQRVNSDFNEMHERVRRTVQFHIYDGPEREEQAFEHWKANSGPNHRKWYAWYPVRLGALGTGRWAWLEWVIVVDECPRMYQPLDLA
jgi:hypothetical protein